MKPDLPADDEHVREMLALKEETIQMQRKMLVTLSSLLDEINKNIHSRLHELHYCNTEKTKKHTVVQMKKK